jgi:hypothetical protein
LHLVLSALPWKAKSDANTRLPPANKSAVNNSEAVERESDFGALAVLGSQGFGT